MKLLLTTSTGIHYVRYVARRYKLFVRVEQHPSPDAISERIDSLTSWQRHQHLEFLGSTTSIGSDHYLLYAIDYDIYDENTERAFKYMAASMRRLSNWYKYAYLIPVSKGQAPETYEQD